MVFGVWAEAHREASARGQERFSTEVLLLALARADGQAGAALAESGATETALSGLLTLDLGDAPVRNEVVEVKADAESIMARARAEGLALGLGVAEAPEHLLLALVYDRSTAASRLLRRMHVDRRLIVNFLKASGVLVPAQEPPADAEERPDRVVLPLEDARLVAAELGRLSTEIGGDSYFDRYGSARWSFGEISGHPGKGIVLAESSVGLRSLVARVLESAGKSSPPESAWKAASDPRFWSRREEP